MIHVTALVPPTKGEVWSLETLVHDLEEIVKEILSKTIADPSEPIRVDTSVGPTLDRLMIQLVITVDKTGHRWDGPTLEEHLAAAKVGLELAMPSFAFDVILMITPEIVAALSEVNGEPSGGIALSQETVSRLWRDWSKHDRFPDLDLRGQLAHMD